MLVMVVFFIAFRWIHLSTPLIGLFLLVLILLLMPTLNFLPFCLALYGYPKFCDCLVRFESSSVPFPPPTAYDVYPFDGRHDGGYYCVKDCVTIAVLPRTPGNNVYVGFMVGSNFTATKCRGLVSLNQVIKEIICLQPLK